MNTPLLPIPAEELLSALMDGELDAAQCALALREEAGGHLVAGQWHAYHVIGRALRLNSDLNEATEAKEAKESRGAQPRHQADQGLNQDFAQRLIQRLAHEKIAPAETVGYALPSQVTAVPDFNSKPAANDATVRWKMLAGVACMGTVAALAWNLSGFNAGDSERQLSQRVPGFAQGQVVVASPQGPMLRDTRLQELLAAHKQMGATSLPVPSGFLRNANFENQHGAQR